MASADKDGRVAQLMGDLAATAVMAVNESLIDADDVMATLLEKVGAELDVDGTPVRSGMHDGVATIQPADPFHRIEFVSMEAATGQITIRYFGRQDGDLPFDEADYRAHEAFIRAAIPILKAMLSAAGETLPS